MNFYPWRPRAGRCPLVLAEFRPVYDGQARSNQRIPAASCTRLLRLLAGGRRFGRTVGAVGVRLTDEERGRLEEPYRPRPVLGHQ
jgi:hypothetical protein